MAWQLFIYAQKEIYRFIDLTILQAQAFGLRIDQSRMEKFLPHTSIKGSSPVNL
jgi:hypothetical protein